MKRSILKNDFIKNRAVMTILALFICVASLLLSLSAILGIHLFSSIHKLMEDSQTPHFMQMHIGDLDQTALEKFAKESSYVSDFQIQNFLGIASEEILIEGKPLTGSLQDNGFCTQNKSFDLLLDLDGNAIEPASGEVYVPVFYNKDGSILQGDRISVNGVHFTVAGFVRDSQMSSALAYSKRFLISNSDYTTLEPLGSTEYLIEFRLHDLSTLGSFSTAYSAACLPANGPSLTYPLFRMINAISDGIMIGLIILVSSLVIMISLFCIRFTLLAKIENDYLEIGTMKAIGIRLSDIRGLYLASYGAVAAIGSLLGFLLSLFCYKPMLASIQLNFGPSNYRIFPVFLGAFLSALLFCLILWYVTINLRRFRKISAVEAIRFGMGDVLTRKRLYGTMLVVVMLASFLLIVPENLYHTISAKSFVTYMGIGQCDLRIDLQQTEDVLQQTELISNAATGDASVSRYAILTTKTFGSKLENGTIENVKIELGDHSSFPVQCINGEMPASEQEIALSALLADEWEKRVGDSVTLLTSQGEQVFSVSGIYSDITNGGKTAKAIFQDNSRKAAWSVICISLNDPSLLPEKLEEYRRAFPFSKISSIEEYVTQTFGPTLRSVRMASIVSVFVAIVITLLVSFLFLKLLVAKDRYPIAVMRALGFRCMDIKKRFSYQVLGVLVVGILLGTTLAGTLGEKIAGMAMSSFGVSAFRFVINIPATYLLFPLLLCLTALLALVLGTRKIGAISISQSIKE